MEPLSTKALITAGWTLFKRAPWRFVVSLLIAFVISTASSTIFNPENGGGAGVVLWGIDMVVQMCVSMGMIAFMLKAHDALEAVALTDAWKPRSLVPYAVASILTGLVVTLGFVLLIVPGVIAAIALVFTSYLILDRGMGPIAAMQESYRLTKGRWGELFVFLLALIGMNVLGALLLGVGLLVSIPVSLLATVRAYRMLTGTLAHTASPKEVMAPVPAA